MPFDIDNFRLAALSDPLVQDIWKIKYRFRDEPSIRESQERVTQAIMADETPQIQFQTRFMISNGYFLPAGRINAGAGTNRNVTLLNCYVGNTIQDSMAGIQLAIAKSAFTLQQGGGIGNDFSTVRPAGALVKRTGSVSSGAIAFMHQMSTMSDTVCSAGERRGAMMTTLADWHADLWNEHQFETMDTYTGDKVLRQPSFISVKRQKGKLTQTNISVLVSDMFMRAVEEDALWDLGFWCPRADGQHVDVYDKPFPHDVIEYDNNFNEVVTETVPGLISSYGHYDGDIKRVRKGDKLPFYVYTRVKARRIWNDLMESTYKYAEPGVIYIDRVNSFNNLNYCEDIRCTNPCFTGDTLVWTIDGPRSFADLASSGDPVAVLTEQDHGMLAYRPMVNPRLTQRRAQLVRVTLKAKRGLRGQTVSITTLRCTPSHEFYLVDGSRCAAANLRPGDRIASAYRTTANQKGYMALRSTSGDMTMEHHVTAEFNYGRRPIYPLEHGHHVNLVRNDNTMGNVEIINGARHNSEHMMGDSNPMRRFPERNHFLTADFSGEKNGRWRNDVSTDDLNKLRDDGLSFAAIAEKIGCSKYMVMKRLGYQRPNHEVVAVEILDEREDVYCGTVPNTGRFFVSLGTDHYEGVLVSNCGEQPLPPFGTCCLGSINVAFMVKNPFTDQAVIDYELYHQAIRLGVRFLDNVLDKANYPLAEQRAESMAKRRIGLGITGVADALLQMRQTYGSEDAIKTMKSLSRRLQAESYRASALLAKERGPFPAYDRDKFLKSKNLIGDVIHLISDNGIRNGVLNTVAPNGTISIYSGNTAQGIEPVFSFEPVKRKVRQPDGSLVDYVSVNYSHRLWNALHPDKELPDYFVSAMDITPEAHILMQAACQYHIDASISKTVNCPSEMSFDDFKNVYQLAYNSGCKGCTTYRPDPDSGRGSVLSVDEKPIVTIIPEPLPAAFTDGNTEWLFNLRKDLGLNALDNLSPEQESDLKRYYDKIVGMQKHAMQEFVVSPSVEVKPAQRVVEARRYKVKWHSENWYVTITRHDGQPFEVFITTGKAESSEWIQTLSRLLTAILRRGGDVRFLINELCEIHSAKGGAFVTEQKRFRPSIVAAIGGVLEEEFKLLGLMSIEDKPIAPLEDVKVVPVTVTYGSGPDSCPECGAQPLVREQGCVRCLHCDYSKC